MPSVFAVVSVSRSKNTRSAITSRWRSGRALIALTSQLPVAELYPGERR
jgi:hypothetical protein